MKVLYGPQLLIFVLNALIISSITVVRAEDVSPSSPVPSEATTTPVTSTSHETPAEITKTDSRDEPKSAAKKLGKHTSENKVNVVERTEIKKDSKRKTEDQQSTTQNSHDSSTINNVNGDSIDINTSRVELSGNDTGEEAINIDRNSEENEIHMNPEDIDLNVTRYCTAARYCEVSLNERCISQGDVLVCGCGQRYQRNPKNKQCQLTDSSDPQSQEFENAWQEHLKLKRNEEQDAIERSDTNDSETDAWKIYSKMSRPHVTVDELEAKQLDEERKAWLHKELERIRRETPQDLELTADQNNVKKTDHVDESKNVASSTTKQF